MFSFCPAHVRSNATGTRARTISTFYSETSRTELLRRATPCAEKTTAKQGNAADKQSADPRKRVPAQPPAVRGCATKFCDEFATSTFKNLGAQKEQVGPPYCELSEKPVPNLSQP